jgi:glycosyltransferase involved in cell wall biosynthesis
MESQDKNVGLAGDTTILKLAKARLVYCDPCLKSYFGHWASHCSAIVAGFKKLGVETYVLSSSETEKNVLETFQAFKIFTVSSYAYTSSDPIHGVEISYQDISTILCQDLLKVQWITKDDWLYFETASPAALKSILLYIQARGESAPKVVVNLIEKTGVCYIQGEDGLKSLLPVNGNPMLWRYTGMSIPAEIHDRIGFVTIEPIFAKLYSELLQQQVNLIPHPFSAFINHRSSEKFTIGFLGSQNQSKGFHMIPGIVEKLQKINLPISIYVHDSLFYMSKELGYLQDMAKQNPNLIIDLSRKDAKQWVDAIQKCDLIVAPYAPEEYATSSSGIACEALAHGIPLVATAGTSLARQLKECHLQELIVEGYTEDSFVQKIQYAFANKELLRAKAAEAQKAWASQNGPIQNAQAIIKLFEAMA